jgi:hypothetical protein
MPHLVSGSLKAPIKKLKRKERKSFLLYEIGEKIIGGRDCP